MNILEEICDVLQVPIKFIHVIGNPFDNIATILLRDLDARDRVRTERSEKVSQADSPEEGRVWAVYKLRFSTNTNQQKQLLKYAWGFLKKNLAKCSLPIWSCWDCSQEPDGDWGGEYRAAFLSISEASPPKKSLDTGGRRGSEQWQGLKLS